MTKRYTEKHVEQLNKNLASHYPHLAQITPDMHISYDGIARLVMLDRYAQKDNHLETIATGDLVIAKIKNDPKFPTLGTGFVTKISGANVTLKVEDEYIGQIDPSLKPVDGVITLPIGAISKPLEIYYEQIARRLAKHLAEGDKKEFEEKFFKEVAEGNIVPAGRVLYGAGSNTNVTYFNCFVMPMPADSRDGISEHRKNVMEIMSRGGGVGTNGSTLRPKNTVALSVGGKSSGAISWLNDLAQLTDLVQQGGSRRGAQMIMLQVWHPDIIEFIISKMQKASVLLWIKNNFKDEIIVNEADAKLKFKPLSSFDYEMLKEVEKSTKNVEFLAKAQSKLSEGGSYEVDNPEFLSGANISVGITNDFMEAVKANKDWTLKFPDIATMSKEQKAFYDKEWHNIGDVREWEKMGYPVKKYHTLKAKELWDLINFCATYSAEPGIFFIDRANEMTNARSYGQKVVCTNPCGEQPLAPYSVCNLAAINLSNFIDHKTKEIFWDKLDETVTNSVRMQDNIIDKTPYFLEQNKSQALGERRVGMGVMGLHDFLIWAGVRYGSKESNELVDKIFERMARASYIASARLAKEKGTFGFQTSVEDLLKTGYISKLPEDVRNEIKANGGLRNSHLLTIAPTGSTGTMAGVSTGLEPYFAFKYYRSGRLGKFMEVDQAIVAEWKQINNWPEGKELPDIFVSAMELSPEEHADTQAIIQRWIDSSISKTVNAPKGYSVVEVEKIYMRLFDKGAKGGTVYVDGSRDAQVLSLDNKKNEMDTQLIPVSDTAEEKVMEVREEHANVPGNKQDRNIGTNAGDICPICKEGTVEDLGGCHSCTNCGAQLKCGL